MCNSGFEFVPELTSAPAPGSELETSEPTGAEIEDSALLPVMYTLVPLIAVLVAIGAAFFVIKQRKAARYAAVIFFLPLPFTKNGLNL